MAIVNLDDELYRKLKSIVEIDNIEFPTIRNFINKAVKEKLDKVEVSQKVEEQKQIIEEREKEADELYGEQ